MILVRLDDALMGAALEAARQSPRLRSNHNFHAPGESLQRMLNAMLRGTYCRPHRHADPDKREIFTALKGDAAVVLFDDAGDVLEVARLSADGPLRQAEIPPRHWHTVVCLSPEAVLYELIEGHYDPATHKKFAPFAPAEGAEAAAGYLKSLVDRLASF